MRKSQFLSVLAALLLVFAGQACASNFGAFEGGVLRIEPPRKVRVYKRDSTVTYRTITVNRPGFFVRDARWSGDKIAVYVSCPGDKDGKVFLYYSFVGYKVIN